MTRPHFPKFAFIALLLFAISFFAKANVARSLHIAGLIVDAKTLAPIDEANIFDADNHLLGTTDKNGYYNITLNITTTGDMLFSLRIRKRGYQDINQNEHWGNLGDGARSLFYFGLKKDGDHTTPFSKLVNGGFGNDIDYLSVSANFTKAKQERLFDNKIEEAKAGNENVLVQIDGAWYIVDSTGWIKLNSSTDLVLIDNKKTATADKLNSILKRGDIKWMTPISGQEAKFAVYTK